jgi:hypothetical protein
MIELIVVNNEDDTKETIYMKSGSTFKDVWDKVMRDKDSNKYLIRRVKDGELLCCQEDGLVEGNHKMLITLREILGHPCPTGFPHETPCHICNLECGTRKFFKGEEEAITNELQRIFHNEEVSC